MDDMTQLTKLTVNLTSRSYASLNRAAEISGDNKTDTVNRALQLYAVALSYVKDGQKVCFADADKLALTDDQQLHIDVLDVDWFKIDRKNMPPSA